MATVLNQSQETNGTSYSTYSVDPLSTSRVPVYHSDEKANYVLPNDSPEQRRLAIQAYHLSIMMKGQIFHAPIDASKITRSVDVGCGTGAVTALMAKSFPGAECYGLDLSPVPDPQSHGPKVKFLQGNVFAQKPTQWVDASGESVLTQDESLFDYIFSRLLVLGITDWPALFEREFALLKPGGWVEAQELNPQVYYDLSGRPISDNWGWKNAISDACAVKGLDLNCGINAKDRMAAAGLQDIQVLQYQLPFGANVQPTEETKAFAQFLDLSFPELLHHAIPRIMESATKEEIEIAREDMKSAFNPDRGMYIPFTVTFGRKPL